MVLDNQEEAVRQGEQWFRKIFDHSHDAIVIIDLASDSILEANPRACTMLQYSRRELLSTPVSAIHPQEMAKLQVFSESVLREGHGWTNELTCLTKSGETLPAEISASVLEIEGRPCMISMVRDIADRKRAEEALQRAYDELREKQVQLVQSEKMASLGHLVAGLAHEINTPLGTLKASLDLFLGSVEKLKAVSPDPEVPPKTHERQELDQFFKRSEKLISASRAAVERMVKIVESLRKFARLDRAELAEVDLHEGIENTLTLLEQEFRGRIEVVRDFGDLPPIRCYPSRLNQVFMNILLNASHAIEEQGQIFITTRAGNGTVLIEIRDTGRGISSENLKRIFDPGFTTKGFGVGTGLGLSIAYEVITRDHTGSIEAESELGKGTTFRITLSVG